MPPPQPPYTPTTMGPPAPPQFLPGYPAPPPAPPAMGDPFGPLLSTLGAQESGATLGGLDLSAIAQGNQAESDARISGLSGLMELLLGDEERRGAAQRSGQSEASERTRAHQRSQQQLNFDHEASMAATARAFEERQAALNARINAAMGRGGAGEPNWYDQQRFETDENIRQAQAIAAIEAAMNPAAAAPDNLADYVNTLGASEVDAYRGDFLRRQPGRTSVRQSQGPQWQSRVNELRPMVAQSQDPIGTVLNYFASLGYGRSADERASMALADLGYYSRG